MNASFSSSFVSVFQPILQIFIIGFVGAILVKRKVLPSNLVKSLSEVTILVFLPCLIFEKIATNFSPELMPKWWLVVLAGFGMPVIGLLAGSLYWMRDLGKKRSMLSFASLQNAVYLVLPIGKAILPNQFNLFATYCFLFVLGFSPFLWSVGKFLSTSASAKISPKEFITPPLVANLLAIFTVFTGINRWIPEVVLNSAELLGSATVPVANFILGATLGGIAAWKWPKLYDCIGIVSIKFIIIPLGVIFILLATKVASSNALLATFLIIESASAPAVSIILQINSYGGDEKTGSGIMLITYLISIIAIPLWLTFWNLKTGFL